MRAAIISLAGLFYGCPSEDAGQDEVDCPVTFAVENAGADIAEHDFGHPQWEAVVEDVVMLAAILYPADDCGDLEPGIEIEIARIMDDIDAVSRGEELTDEQWACVAAALVVAVQILNEAQAHHQKLCPEGGP